MKTNAFFSLLIAMLLFFAAGFAQATTGDDTFTKVKIGQQAPDFKLISTTGKEIGLKDFRGKSMVLIEFYHADFGPS